MFATSLATGRRNAARPKTRNVQIKVTESNQKYISFELLGSDTAYANALRRLMIAEVPTLAIDIVYVEENSSPLFDEFITHRLGLIPLVCSSLAEMNCHYHCQCELGCDRCVRHFSLDVHNTGNTTRVVTSADLVCSSQDTIAFPTSPDAPEEGDFTDVAFDQYQYGEIPPISKYPIVLTKLGPGQSLRLTCIAKKSIGKEHGKWIPGHVAMFPRPIIELDQAKLSLLTPQQRRELANTCPTGTIVYRENLDVVEVGNLENGLTTLDCIRKCDELKIPNAIRIEEDSQHYFFKVESFGQLPPKEIVRQALLAFHHKLDTISSELGKTKAAQSATHSSHF